MFHHMFSARVTENDDPLRGAYGANSRITTITANLNNTHADIPCRKAEHIKTMQQNYAVALRNSRQRRNTEWTVSNAPLWSTGKLIARKATARPKSEQTTCNTCFNDF
eukprot:8258268-Pyramimonas_sp.AAC.1